MMQKLFTSDKAKMCMRLKLICNILLNDRNGTIWFWPNTEYPAEYLPYCQPKLIYPQIPNFCSFLKTSLEAHFGTTYFKSNSFLQFET